MHIRKPFWILLMTPVVVVALMQGCSDKTFTTTSVAIPENASATVYIPLDQGWRINYVLLEPETEYFEVEITDPVYVAGYPGFTVRRTNRQTGEIQTWYLYEKGTAIFESSSLQDPGARILESPFVIGNTWDRYDTSTTISTSLSGNGEDSNDSGIVPDGHKTKPDGAYSTMSIVNIESVTAMNGMSYGNCLKVAWQTGESTYSYFWYAPGVGLVKFEQNINTISLIDNRTIGVMTDYQHVEY